MKTLTKILAGIGLVALNFNSYSQDTLKIGNKYFVKGKHGYLLEEGRTNFVKDDKIFCPIRTVYKYDKVGRKIKQTSFFKGDKNSIFTTIYEYSEHGKVTEKTAYDYDGDG
ncbi:MAG: hypothetical protein AABX80_01265, partial [Nanoarchaeota archaeon]